MKASNESAFKPWQARDRVDDLTYRLQAEKKKKEAKNKEEAKE